MRSIQMPLFGFEAGIRGIARLLAASLVGVVLLIFVGQGGLNPLTLSALEAVQMVFFFTTCIGMVVGWRCEMTGGIMAMAGILLFYATEAAVIGRFPNGWAFRLMLLPGILFLLSGVLRRWRFRERVS